MPILLRMSRLETQGGLASVSEMVGSYYTLISAKGVDSSEDLRLPLGRKGGGGKGQVTRIGLKDLSEIKSLPVVNILTCLSAH